MSSYGPPSIPYQSNQIYQPAPILGNPIRYEPILSVVPNPHETLAQAITFNDTSAIQEILQRNHFSSMDFQNIYSIVAERGILSLPNASNHEKARIFDRLIEMISLGAPKDSLMKLAFQTSTDPLLFLVLRRAGVYPTPEETPRFNAIVSRLWK